MVTSRSSRRPAVLGGVLAVLVLLVVIVRWQLNNFLLREVRTRAAPYADKLGRSIQVQQVSVGFLPSLSVHVGGVAVGPAEGERLPLLALSGVDVRVDLLKAALSKGKDVVVHAADVQGLSLNVVRLPDGTTNLQKAAERLSASEPAEKQPEPQAAPSDLSGVRVEEVSLRDGKVSLVDETHPGSAPLAISHIDFTLKDLQAGKPLLAELKAAVLADAQNLALTLATAPLPSTLVPTPEQLTLKVQPIDLAPLGPFLPPTVGLQAGHLDADLTLRVGGAVPGGSGPTALKGVLHALGLRFAQSRGGKPLDVTLDSALEGDLRRGDLAIQKLQLQAGPAGLEGHGSVSGLAGPTPSVQGLEVVGHDLDPAVLAEYVPGLRAALHGEVEGPIGLTLKGSGSERTARVTLTLDFTPVRLAVPETLVKAKGEPMRLVLEAHGSKEGTQGALQFQASADLKGVDLRPGKELNKPPGQPLDLALEGSYRQGAAADTRVQLDSLTAHLLADTVTGSGFVEMSGPSARRKTRFNLKVDSPRLDADALLLPSEEGKGTGSTPAKRAPGKASPAPDPHRFDGDQGQLALHVGTLRYHKTDLTQVAVELTLANDLLTLTRLSANVLGGTVDASGTRVHLAPAEHPFDAALKLRDLDATSALALAGTDKKWLTGHFNGDLHFTGAGADSKALTQNLTGDIQGHLLDGVLASKDIVASISEPLAKALPFATRLKGGQGGSGSPGTSLGKDLPLGVHVENGIAKLKAPLKVSTPEADLQMDGGMHLDGMLALGGLASLTPATIRQLTGGKVTVGAPIPVAFKLTGPAWSPTVSGLDLGPAVKSILQQAAAQGVGKLLGDKGQRALNQLLGGGSNTPAANPQDAANQAQQKADEAKKQLQDEAKKQLNNLFGR